MDRTALVERIAHASARLGLAPPPFPAPAIIVAMARSAKRS
jgi:hypothetical protein